MWYYSNEKGKALMAVARSKKNNIRAARLDIRLNVKAKEKIEQAAVSRISRLPILLLLAFCVHQRRL
jgi:hypothetical protein